MFISTRRAWFWTHKEQEKADRPITTMNEDVAPYQKTPRPLGVQLQGSQKEKRRATAENKARAAKHNKTN
jgi:hypothetical protein